MTPLDRSRASGIARGSGRAAPSHHYVRELLETLGRVRRVYGLRACACCGAMYHDPGASRLDRRCPACAERLDRAARAPGELGTRD